MSTATTSETPPPRTASAAPRHGGESPSESPPPTSRSSSAWSSASGSCGCAWRSCGPEIHGGLRRRPPGHSASADPCGKPVRGPRRKGGGRPLCHANLAEETRRGGKRPANNQDLAQLARQLTPGSVLVLFQPRLELEVEGWLIRGDADLVRLERDAEGRLDVLITDMKSTTTAKVEHRLQVAFYHLMLTKLFEGEGIAPLRIRPAILYRGKPQPAGQAADEKADCNTARRPGSGLASTTPFWKWPPTRRPICRRSRTSSPGRNRPPAGFLRPVRTGSICPFLQVRRLPVQRVLPEVDRPERRLITPAAPERGREAGARTRRA